MKYTIYTITIYTMIPIVVTVCLTSAEEDCIPSRRRNRLYPNINNNYSID